MKYEKWDYKSEKSIMKEKKIKKLHQLDIDNLIKSGNKVDFMNDFFKIIVGFELIVPKSVINVMSERDFDFETFGYAFISGLLGEEDENRKGNNDQKINENKENKQDEQ